jgi:hypothetical protein
MHTPTIVGSTMYGSDTEIQRDAAGVVALGDTTAAAVKASTWVELTEITKPANPAATKLRLYVKAVSSATEIFTLDSAGVESNLTARLVTNGDTHDHIGGDGSAIAEGALTLSNVTTADVTTGMHGFVPRAPNDVTKFFRGDATWDYTPATVWAALNGEPTGFPNRTDSTVSFNTTSREFSIAPAVTSFDFYSKGTKFTKSVAQTVTLDDTTGLWSIYFDASGVLQKTSGTWNLDGGIVPVQTVYWNSALADGRLGEERHGLVMDWATHQYFHECLGSRYVNGFGGTFGNTTFTITEGVYRDEDIRAVIGEQTQCRILRRSSGNWVWTAKGTDYYTIQNTNVCYDNAGTLTEMGSNAYVAYWFFVGNDPTCPIYVVMGQRTDITLADARTNNTYDQLSLTNLPFAEMKVLFRVILRNDATPYEEAQDLRSLAVVSSGTYVATDHQSLTNRQLLGAHPASAITVVASGFTGKLSGTDVDVQTALGTLDAHTHAPPAGDTQIIYNDTGAWAVATIYQLKASGYTGIGQAAPGERLHLKDGSGNGAIVIGAHQNATALAGTVEWDGTNVRWYTGAVWKNVGVDVTDPMTYKGALNCSTNPNYPAADAGDTYRVSVAGKIGGASGPNVEAGDMMVCTTDSTPTGDHATVGAYWDIIQMNLDGAVVGPGSSTDHALVRWNSTTGTSALDSTVIVGDDGAVSLRGTAQQLTSYNNTILSLAGAGTGYARIGLSGTTSHTFNTDADLLVAGRLEVNGVTYLDGNVEVVGTTTLATALGGLLKATAGLISAASAGTDYQAPITFQHSITGTTTVNLVNDSATPGNTKLYGTNASGTKGWYDQPASSSGGGASSWTAVTPFTRTADSTFTVTDNATNQGIFVAGRPLRYRATASTWRYGIVTGYSTGTVTIAGAPMTANDDDELNYGSYSNVVLREFRLDGYFAPVASTQLLADIMGQWARWEHGTAYLVRVVHRVESIDTGASQPRLNAVVNGNKVGTANSNNGWDMSGSAWVSSAVDISTVNYVVANAQTLELSTDANGTNDDAMTASVQLAFVLE